MKGWNELFQRCSGTGMTWNTPASINICVYTAFGFYRFEFSFTLVFLSYTCERVYIELNCMIKLVTVCQKDGRMRMTLKKRHALRLGICWFATTPNFTLQLNLKPLLFRLNENVCVSFSRHSFITPTGHNKMKHFELLIISTIDFSIYYLFQCFILSIHTWSCSQIFRAQWHHCMGEVSRQYFRQ
jgi:hypothetical protein